MKNCYTEDLFNILPRNKITESETSKFQSVIDNKTKIDGINHFHYIQNEEGDEFYGLFYQNNRMKNFFKTYSSVTFIDVTCLFNQENFPVVNFVVKDHNRQSITIDAVLNYFEILDNTSTVMMVLIDKDLKEGFAAQKAFPKSLYFSWHNENTLKKNFKGDSFECVKQMMLAEIEEEFNLFFEKFKLFGKDRIISNIS